MIAAVFYASSFRLQLTLQTHDLKPSRLALTQS